MLRTADSSISPEFLCDMVLVKHFIRQVLRGRKSGYAPIEKYFQETSAAPQIPRDDKGNSNTSREVVAT